MRRLSPNIPHILLQQGMVRKGSHSDVISIGMDDNLMYKNMMSAGMCSRYLFIAIYQNGIRSFEKSKGKSKSRLQVHNNHGHSGDM